MFRLLYLLDVDNTSEEDGRFGEMIANNIFHLYFKNQESYLFKDLYVEDDRGVHQIDHIFILKNGIFVVETKNISGRIYGSINSDIWTIVYDKNHQYPLLNPLIQNDSHIAALTYIFRDVYDFQSVIVFPHYKKPAWCVSDKIFSKKEFINHLSNFKPEKELTHEDMAYIVGVLNDIQSNKKELKEKFKQQIKARS